MVEEGVEAHRGIGVRLGRTGRDAEVRRDRHRVDPGRPRAEARAQKIERMRGDPGVDRLGAEHRDHAPGAELGLEDARQRARAQRVVFDKEQPLGRALAGELGVLRELGVPHFVRVLHVHAERRVELLLDELREAPRIVLVAPVRQREPRLRAHQVGKRDHHLDRRAALPGPGAVGDRRALRPGRYRAVVGAHPVHEAQHRVAAQPLGEHGIEDETAIRGEGDETPGAAVLRRGGVGERVAFADTPRHDDLDLPQVVLRVGGLDPHEDAAVVGRHFDHHLARLLRHHRWRRSRT